METAKRYITSVSLLRTVNFNLQTEQSQKFILHCTNVISDELTVGQVTAAIGEGNLKKEK